MNEEKFEEVIKYKKFQVGFPTVLIFCVMSSINAWVGISLLIVFLYFKKQFEAERYYKKIKEKKK